MNILIMADIVTFSGVGNYIKTLCHEYVELGHSVTLLSPINDLKLGDNDGVNYVQIKSLSAKNIPSNLKIIHKTIKEHKIDVVHAQHRKICFLMKLYNIVYKHVATVWTAHTVPYPMNLAKKILGYYGDKAIAISSEAKDFMINTLKIKSSNIKMVLNGVDCGKLTPLLECEKNDLIEKYGLSDKIVLCAHGRIDRVKGLDVLIDAVAMLEKATINRLKILISGNCKDNLYYDELVKKIESYGLQDVFVFVGWIETRKILGVSDLMIQPSRREGFPLAAIEAFHMGVPVVRSMVSGYTDMKDYCVGIPVDDKEAIKINIEKFLEDPKIFGNMAENAMKWAQENCTSKRSVINTLDVYNSIIVKE